MSGHGSGKGPPSHAARRCARHIRGHRRPFTRVRIPAPDTPQRGNREVYPMVPGILQSVNTAGGTEPVRLRRPWVKTVARSRDRATFLCLFIRRTRRTKGAKNRNGASMLGLIFFLCFVLFVLFVVNNFFCCGRRPPNVPVRLARLRS